MKVSNIALKGMAIPGLANELTTASTSMLSRLLPPSHTENGRAHSQTHQPLGSCAALKVESLESLAGLSE
jgi:hypothetical protein